MSLKLGIIGLPNVGKSTLFNALTSQEVEAANYPFCTIDPNVGIVPLPDERLNKLGEIAGAEKVTPAYIQYVDVAGLVQGASRGEGLGNQFLAHIREVDALVQILRGFQDSNVAHVKGRWDPVEDLQIVNYELIMADLETLQKRREKAAKMMKADREKYQEELSFLEKLEEHLNQGGMARNFPQRDEYKGIMEELFLLTDKPVIYVLNIEEDIEEEKARALKEKIRKALGEKRREVLLISVRLEKDLQELTPPERKEYLEELSWRGDSLNTLISSSFRLLNLITFFTAKGEETRAWTIPRGTRAVKAAGKIHTDMEQGFIRAEVIPFAKLEEAGSFPRARELGWIRLEGRDYEVQEGDVIQFRFNL